MSLLKDVLPKSAFPKLHDLYIGRVVIATVLALVVLGRVLTLGTPNPELPEQNLLNGLGFMWNPGHVGEQLLNPELWLAAAGQVFFSLSVGFGVILNYASYLKKKDDIALSGLTASSTNELFEVGFGGLITVTATFVFLGASGVGGSTFGLGFNTLPVVFEHMGSAGRFIGFAWFFLLFLAAITSSRPAPEAPRELPPAPQKRSVTVMLTTRSSQPPR